MSTPFAAGRKRLRFLIGALAVLLLIGQQGRAESPAFALKDGDRIILLGGTFIERDQYYGYFETILTTRLPDKNLTFRNLGWSGDTVTGISRARFGPVAEGFQHIKDHVEALKPTVIIVGYGANEAFEGEAGLPQFRTELNTLLDTLVAGTHARIVLLSPIKAEKKPAPLPDPARHNADLRLYSEAIGDLAKERNMTFIDLYELVPMNDGAEIPMTDNGIHLTAYGYWRAGEILAKELGAPVQHAFVEVHLNEDGTPAKDQPKHVRDLKKTDHGVQFTATQDLLPLPAAPVATITPEPLKPRGVAIAKELPEVRYQVVVDGKPVTGPIGVEATFLVPSVGLEQVEEVRSLINAKNRQYFYRWRPQNETYLFGFRKHEQGQNAREIPEFDPIVAELETRIATLRTPKPHTYELICEGEVAR
jgi:lysophospholipase L1-like esterase